MPRERAAVEDAGFHDAVWQRARWLHMGVGTSWAPGAYAAAEDQYAAIDAMPIPAEEKIRRLADYLGSRSDPDQVQRELRRFEGVVRRFPAEVPPVRRLRLTLPDS